MVSASDTVNCKVSISRDCIPQQKFKGSGIILGSKTVYSGALIHVNIAWRDYSLIGHIVKNDWFSYSKTVMGEKFGERSPMWKPTSRGEDVAWRKFHNLFQVWNWKATMRKKVGGRGLGRSWPENRSKDHRRRKSRRRWRRRKRRMKERGERRGGWGGE